MRICAAFLSCVVAFPAAAQTIAPHVDPMTASGEFAIVDSPNGWARRLHVGDTIFLDHDAYRFVEILDQRGALYLLGLSDGGNACGVVYAWLHTEGGVPRMTEEFGTCAPYVDVWSDSETVSVSMWSDVNHADLVGYVYDGKLIREVTLDPPAGPVGPNDDLAALVGAHPISLFRAAQWRPILRGLLGRDFSEVADRFDLSSGFAGQGMWLVARAHMVPRRGGDKAVLALHRLDGRVVVAWSVDGAEFVLRGTPDQLLDEIIAEALAPL